jgi:serine/threonine protein phosphatase PrpC
MKDMYDTLFHDYRTPPYLTARPDELEGVPDDFELRANEGNMVVLGTDGLWDIATPEEVRDLLLMAIRGGALRRGRNLAEYLLETLIEEKGRKPGDDVSIAIICRHAP